MNYVYLVTQNSDLMEGKGRQEPQGYFTDEYAALRLIETLPTDMGGSKSAEIKKIPVAESFTEYEWEGRYEAVRGDRVWGYRRGWDGKWGEGWLDDRDAPTHDPEYQEFQRLLKKFGGER